MKQFSNTSYINSIKNSGTVKQRGTTLNWLPITIVFGAGILFALYIFKRQQKQIEFLRGEMNRLNNTTVGHESATAINHQLTEEDS